MTTVTTNTRFVNVSLGSANQAIATATWTTVLFNVIQTDGETSAMYDATNGDFIAPQSGWYDIEAEITWASAQIGAVRVIQNGDSTHPIYVRSNTVAQSNNIIKYRTFLGTNGYLQIQVRQDSGGPIDILSSLDPFAVSQPAITTNATFTLIKPSPSVIFNAF